MINVIQGLRRRVDPFDDYTPIKTRDKIKIIAMKIKVAEAV